ncbi:MAG: superoxide dismutase [Parcubacteria group bacterium]|nr:superoxide dismutase [Parcubacteria group bacterium]
MYTVKKFEHLIGTPGFSEDLLQDHFTLYEGYVKNTNVLLEKMAKMDMSTPEGAEVRRRFGWEYNGMKLHELYFGNITKDAESIDSESNIGQRLVKEYGSLETWEKDFRAAGVMRGIGWVVLSEDPDTGGLLNTWVNEHNVGHLAGATPLLVMDVFEHAYLKEYGLKRAEYVDAFMEAIDWRVVERRMRSK